MGFNSAFKGLILTWITVTLLEELSTFMIIYRWILFRARSVSETKVVEKNQITHFISITFFSVIYAVYEITWKNIAVSDRSKMATQYSVRALYAGCHDYRHTAASMYITYCFSTATVAALTRLSITLRFTHIVFHISKIPNTVWYSIWVRGLLQLIC
jgi:hypothetical protein